MALALPPKHAARWAANEITWIGKQPSLDLLGERLGQLVVHLAAAGESDVALTLAGRLFETAPDTARVHMMRDVRIKLSGWEFDDLLRRSMPVLIATLGAPAFEFLQDSLSTALQITDPEGLTGGSWMWRPAIEDHDQNFGHRPLDSLVAAVRDGGGHIIQGEILQVSDVVTGLLGRGGIFARIGLHLLARFGESAQPLVAQCVGNRTLFDNFEVRHEYDALSEAWFGRVGDDTRRLVLSWVEAGPREDHLARWRERLGSDAVPVEIQRWQRDRLYPLRGSLPDAWSRRYDELLATVGELDRPPSFAIYRRTCVGAIAPKGAEELRSMNTSELLEFLAEWKPKEDRMEPTEEGLGRRLQEVVEAEPVRFAQECEQFRSVDPTYVRAVLAGLTSAVRAGKQLEMPRILALCSWVLEQPREIPGRQTSSVRRFDRDPDWGWTRKQIADLLVVGLENRANGIPLSERRTVWRLLEALSTDPDPDVSYNEQASLDLLSQALNCVRGQAMHGVMNYSLWVHRNAEDQHGLPLALGLVPEVATRLDLGLDPQREPTHAVRGVYGRWLRVLAGVDPEWTRTHVHGLFPNAPESASLRAATWEGYLDSAQPDADMYALLRQQYEWAVDHLGVPRAITARTFRAKADERLTEHLIALYWQGLISLDVGGLLQAFYQRASLALREYAISYAGRCLHGTKPEELPLEFESRLRDLFERRLAVAMENAETATELRGFPWWFSAQGVDVEWRFAQLKRVMACNPPLDGEFLVMEELVRHLRERPLEVLECVELLLRTANPWHLVIGSRARFEAILSATASSDNQVIREKAVALIHRIGALGHPDFRRLFREAERSN